MMNLSQGYEKKLNWLVQISIFHWISRETNVDLQGFNSVSWWRIFGTR
jgi:hypothetical protein